MRLRVCKHCRDKFRPNRSDAEFCCRLCRQAAYRTRKSNNSAEVAKRKADDAHFAVQALENYQAFATLRHFSAEADGIKGVKFIGTPHGVLAVEETPGAMAVARASRMLWGMRETESHSKHPDVLAILPPPMLGGSFIRRETERKCRELLRGPERKVSLFTVDWEYYKECQDKHYKGLPAWVLSHDDDE